MRTLATALSARMARVLWGLLLASTLLRAACTVLDAATLQDTATGFAFADDAIELSFDGQTGLCTRLTHAPTGMVAAQADQGFVTDIQVGDHYVSDVGDKPPVMLKRRMVAGDGVDTLAVTTRHGDWTICNRYDLYETGILRRRADLVYDGPAPPTFTQIGKVRFVLPNLVLGESDRSLFSAPADFPPRERAIADLTAIRNHTPPHSAASFRALAVRNPRRNLALVTAYYCEEERALLTLRERPGGLDAVHLQMVTDQLTPGWSMTAGSQLLRFTGGDLCSALAGLRSFYPVPGLRTDISIRPTAGKAVFYSAHAGGTIDSHFRDTGGFANFAKLLPLLSDLGMNVVWLLPFWHGSVYAPDDYTRLAPNCGTPDELKHLTHTAHGYDMRVLGDLIPHGPRDTLGFSKTHGDLVCRHRDGSLQYWWGCLYCDYANPGWQQYMAEHAAYWVERCGLDGYRVDVAGGGPPNWEPAPGNRPSASGLKGGLELLRRARNACLKINPDALFLAETHGVSLYSAADHEYNWAFSDLLERHLFRQPIEQWVGHVLRYLENQRFAFPPEAYPVRFLTNHDKVRARMRYGPGLHRALLAFCAFIKGVPLIYHEQEMGDEDFLKQLYGIRGSFDELALGEPDYLSVSATPGQVMAFGRQYNGRTSAVLINFSAERVDSTVTIPGQDCDVGLYDAVRRGRVPRLGKGAVWEAGSPVEVRVPLPPFGYTVLLVRAPGDMPADVPASPILPSPPPGRLTVTREGARYHIANGHYTALIDGSRGGLLHSLAARHGPVLLRGQALREGNRKLLVGVPPFDISAHPALVQVMENTPEAVCIQAVTAIRDSTGTPIADTTLTYRASRDHHLHVDCTVTPRRNVGRVKSILDLCWRFSPSSHWFANTVEGPLLGRAVFRHAPAPPHRGRYWHGAGEAFYQSSLYPLHPLFAETGVLHSNTRCSLGVEVSAPDLPLTRVALLEDRESDSPRQVGGPAAVTARLRLCNGRDPMVWIQGQPHTASLTFTVRRENAEALQRRLEATPSPLGLKAFGSLYTLTRGPVSAKVLRSAGGQLLSFGPTGDPVPFSAARFYTDQGLFGEWTDPRGMRRTMRAGSQDDPEPDTNIEQVDGAPALWLNGRFRHPHGNGRSLLRPGVDYRLAYHIDRDGRLKVRCSARPQVTRQNTKAFLAAIYSLSDISAYRVDSDAWAPPPKQSRRVWESAAAGALPRRICLRQSSGKTVSFTDFVTNSGSRPAQNVFLHAGGNHAVVFLAFYDMQEADIIPEWVTIDFAMNVETQP